MDKLIDNEYICKATELAEILQVRSVHLSKAEDLVVRTVLTDSRSLCRAEGTIFFAIRTPSGDGHRYISELYSQGVRLFVVEEDAMVWQVNYPEACFYVVVQSVRALQLLAEWHRTQLQRLWADWGKVPPLIAITGSNGKTIVKEMLARLLHGAYRQISRSPGSYNSQIGVALSLLQTKVESDLILIEAGISQAGEMASLEQMIAPDYLVLTHIGQAHLQNFDSSTALIDEKLTLAEGTRLKAIFASLDEPLVIERIQQKRFATPLIAYSLEGNPSAFLSVTCTDEGESLSLTLGFGGQSFHCRTNFTDRASLNNLLLSLTVVAYLRSEIFSDVLMLVPMLEAVEMRLELKESLTSCTLINDCYTCDLDALAIALDLMRRKATAQEAHSRMGVILSDLDHGSALGDASTYEALRLLLLSYGVERIYTIGKEIEAMQGLGFTSRQHFSSVAEFLSSREAGRALEDNDILLVKGARRFGFEQIVRQLSRREHQTQLEVNLSHLRHNLAYYRSLLPEAHPIICMIKANAYGLGAYEVARTLEENHVHALAVALVDEGKALRQRGIRLPIIVMNPEPSSLESLLRYELDMEVYDPELLREVIRLGRIHGRYPRIHLKLETGMYRLGVEWSCEELAEYVLQTEGQLELAVFSHLARADEAGGASFTHRQAARLQSFASRLELAIQKVSGGRLPTKPICRHLLNTAGIETYASLYAFDAVRLGIGLYGYSPLPSTPLEPMARLVTTILQTKTLPAGEGLGYGLTDVSDRERRIAILPIGYADGLPRRLSGGRWSMRVGDKLCPIVGRICMDICMIDISAVPEAKAGDRVLVFGEGELSLEHLAKAADTITYEILTGISPRVERVYLQS